MPRSQTRTSSRPLPSPSLALARFPVSAITTLTTPMLAPSTLSLRQPRAPVAVEAEEDERRAAAAGGRRVGVLGGDGVDEAGSDGELVVVVVSFPLHRVLLLRPFTFDRSRVEEDSLANQCPDGLGGWHYLRELLRRHLLRLSSQSEQVREMSTPPPATS